jgi:hypothetical protein
LRSAGCAAQNAARVAAARRALAAILPLQLPPAAGTIDLRLSRLIVTATVLLMAYGMWPVYAAYQIRTAMVAGDTATLAAKVEWEKLRTSLKASLSPETVARLETDPEAPQPSLWQRIKSTVAPALADTVIDRYVTPENLPSLVGYHRFYRGTVRPALGLKDPPTALAETWLEGTPVDRFVSFWRRLRRAVYHTPTRFEFEVQDKYQPLRSYSGTIELRGLQWKLTNLTIVGAGL